MNDKLLIASIEAGGYEIEEVEVKVETPIGKERANSIITLEKLKMNHCQLITDDDGDYKRGECGCYYVFDYFIDYKVTKKKVNDVKGYSWNEI